MEEIETLTNLKLMVVISKLVKSLDRRLEPEIKDYGLTFTQFTVLEAIYNKGPQSVNQIIERTLSSSGNMGIVINNLLKSGLIVKKVNLADKRSRVIDLTDKGFNIINELFPQHVKSINSSFSSLELVEKQKLIDVIKKLGKGVLDE